MQQQPSLDIAKISETKTLVAVVGPTSVGKTAFAIRLAQQLNGEIVGADSRQIYRHMDVGTAKPSTEQRAAVPHHMIDIICPNESYNLALFLRQASSTIEDIFRKEKLPILVGGTGQYVWGILEGWKVPKVPADSKLRATLESKADCEGAQVLFQELQSIDPVAARCIDPKNTRRVIRAIEVFLYRSDNARFQQKKTPLPYNVTTIGLTMDRKSLYLKIENTVDSMIQVGWIIEVEALLARGYGIELPSMSGIGYRELAQYLSGDILFEEAVYAIKGRTRKFARKQYTWFKPSDDRICWFEVSPKGLDSAIETVKRAVGPKPFKHLR